MDPEAQARTGRDGGARTPGPPDGAGKTQAASPPKPVEQEKPKEEPKPVPQEQKVEQARKKAEKQLSHVRDELADLRREFATALPETRNLTAGAGAEARSDRSLIAAKAGTGSAGVASADSSRGFGGGAGALGTHSTGAVTSSVAAISGADKSAAGANGKGKRGQEAFEEEFDRNKGALYALYTRALRERPELQGKLVLEIIVAPSGEVTACRVGVQRTGRCGAGAQDRREGEIDPLRRGRFRAHHFHQGPSSSSRVELAPRAGGRRRASAILEACPMIH